MTPRQQEVLDVVLKYRAEHGLSPTYEEVADKVGLSKARVGEHVNELIKLGHLRRIPHKTRGIEPAGEELVVKSEVLAVIDRAKVDVKKSSAAAAACNRIRVAVEAMPIRRDGN